MNFSPAVLWLCLSALHAAGVDSYACSSDSVWGCSSLPTTGSVKSCKFGTNPVYYPPLPLNMGTLLTTAVTSTSEYESVGWKYDLRNTSSAGAGLSWPGFGSGTYHVRSCGYGSSYDDNTRPVNAFMTVQNSGAMYWASSHFNGNNDYAGICTLDGSYRGLWISLQVPSAIVVTRMTFRRFSVYGGS